MTREQLIGVLDGNTLTVDSNWVKNNDADVFGALLQAAVDFEASGAQIETIKSGDWLIRYFFAADGFSLIAGEDIQSIVNQSDWAWYGWEHVGENQMRVYAAALEVSEGWQ